MIRNLTHKHGVETDEHNSSGVDNNWGLYNPFQKIHGHIDKGPSFGEQVGFNFCFNSIQCWSLENLWTSLRTVGAVILKVVSPNISVWCWKWRADPCQSYQSNPLSFVLMVDCLPACNQRIYVVSTTQSTHLLQAETKIWSNDIIIIIIHFHRD